MKALVPGAMGRETRIMKLGIITSRFDLGNERVSESRCDREATGFMVASSEVLSSVVNLAPAGTRRAFVSGVEADGR